MRKLTCILLFLGLLILPESVFSQGFFSGTGGAASTDSDLVALGALLPCTAANQLLGQNAANDALECKDSIAIQSISDVVYFVGQTDATKTLRFDLETNLDAGDDVVGIIPDFGGDLSFTLSASDQANTWSVAQTIPTLITNYNGDTLSDTSTPHGLTALEVSGTVISNYDSSPEAKEFDLPAAATGYNVIFAAGLAQSITIDPNGTDVIYLNGTALAAGAAVINATPTIGESITCFTFQYTAAAWGWICKSGDAAWVTE